jgi:hypothetical protein
MQWLSEKNLDLLSILDHMHPASVHLVSRNVIRTRGDVRARSKDSSLISVLRGSIIRR